MRFQRGSSMAKQRDVAFRSAMSGYNRKDVNAYIIEINREFEAREAELTAKITSAEESAAEAAKAAETAREEAQAARQAKDEAEAILVTLRESGDALKEENARLSEEIAALQAKLAEAEKAAIADPESDEIKKSMKYDQISAQIGDILINANSSADRIVAAANAEATRIMTETEDEATYIRARLSDAADRMLTHISTELHASTDHCLGELMTALREMRDNTGALLADFEKRNRDLKEKVAYYQTSLNDTIHKALTEMDQKYGIRLPNRKD